MNDMAIYRTKLNFRVYDKNIRINFLLKIHVLPAEGDLHAQMQGFENLRRRKVSILIKIFSTKKVCRKC